MNDAYAPWLPTLQDIEVRKDDVEVGEYYKKFGWDQLVVPDDCPIIAGRMANLKILFDQKYAFRMINSETLEQWQIRLQARFDRYAHIYERAYTLYSTYSQELIDDMIGGETRRITKSGSESRKITRSGSETGTGSESGDVRNVNTPDAATNADDRYADSRSKSSGTSSSSLISSEDTTDGLISSDDITDRLIKTGEGLIDNINSGFRKFIDIDQDFIRQFEDSFLNLFWY